MKLTLVRRGARWVGVLLAVAVLVGAVVQPAAARDRPNVLVIWSDDIGVWHISA